MKTLKDYLGLWSYSHASAELFYNVEPFEDVYRITWGNSIESATEFPKFTRVVDAPEALRRLQSKARGGYTLYKPYSGECPPSADLPVKNSFSFIKRKQTNGKSLSPEKKFNFIDWLMGE